MNANQCGTAKNAIDALSNPQTTKSANEWLMQFEKSSDAWSVSEQLLMENNPTYRFFGAKFLYSKIQKQSILLNDQQKNSLQETLGNQIVRISSLHQGDSQVIRYLCLCLSALVLQVGQDGIVQLTLQRLNPLVSIQATALVTFISVLPEEVYNGQIDISPNLRDNFLIQLSGCSTEVLTFLEALWCNNNSLPDRCKMIKCFTNWLDITTIPFTVVKQQKIYFDCLATLPTSKDELLEHCVDLVLTLIRRYQQQHMEEILEFIIPRITQLQSRWGLLETQYNQINPDDVDESFAVEAYALSKLFTETSECCIEIFLELQRDFGQQILLQVLLRCCSYPFDHNVARTPHKFFYDLSLLLKGNDFDSEPRMKALFNAIYTELVVVSLNQLIVREAEDSKLDERNDWKEAILDCQDVLGSVSCFNTLCVQLQGVLKEEPVAWNKVEAIFFALQITVSSISDLSVASTINELAKMCCQTPKDNILLQTTCISFLGSLSYWLDKPNIGMGPLVFDTLLSYLVEEKLSLPASAAIVQIWRSYGASLSAQVYHVSAKLEWLQVNTTLGKEVELNLIESVFIGISFLDAAQQNAVGGKIISNVQYGLSEALKASNNKLVVQNIDKLVVVCKVVTSSTLLGTVFSHIWPTMQAVFAHNIKESIVEKLCKCLKYSIRGCKNDIAWALPAIAEVVSRGFSTNGYSAYLYCTGVCISTFGLQQSGQYQPLLYSLVWSLSNNFFSRFADISAFEQHPDVVEEYFYMISKLLQYCPTPFVEAQNESASILNAAIVGIQIHNREAQKGMLQFLEKFCEIPRFYGDSLEKYQSAKLMVNSFSSKIIHSMMTLICGVATSFAIDERNGCVVDVLWSLRREIGQSNFEPIFKAVLLQMPKYGQEIAHKLDLANIVTASKSQRDFSSIIDRFEMSCRRNMC